MSNFVGCIAVYDVHPGCVNPLINQSIATAWVWHNISPQIGGMMSKKATNHLSLYPHDIPISVGLIWLNSNFG